MKLQFNTEFYLSEYAMTI